MRASRDWLVLAAAAAARVALGPHPIDDAYITFRYAARLAAGQGFTYNPGAHVLGTTTPLFTLLLASARVAGIGPIAASFGIAVIADLVTIAATMALLRRAGLRAAATLAGLLLAFWPNYVAYVVSGMETPLYVALLMLGLVGTTTARPARAGIWTGLAGLCRPDAALLAIVIGPWEARRARRDAIRYLAIAAAVVAPWVVFATLYFGSPIPNSIVAKASATSPRGIGLAVFAAYFVQGRYLILSAVAAAGAAHLWRRAAALRVWQIWWLVYAAAFIATGAFSEFPWYFVPLLPLYLASIAVAVDAAVEWTCARAHWAARVRGPAWAAILILAAAIGTWRLTRHASTLADWSGGREVLYEATARDLAREAGGAPCVLAATEIGALGYYYPGPVLDLAGLVSAEAVGQDPGTVLRASRARWLVSYDTHFDRATAGAPWFQEGFRLVRRVEVGPARALEVYERTPNPCDAAAGDAPLH